MSKGELPAVLRDVETLFHRGTLHGLTDAQLLDRFRSEPAPGAELAFAGLVARHGSLVLGVCRRALRDPNDVADAFQATFLVLVRKAETVQARDSLGRWLYGVSRRVAIRARRTAAKRAAREVDAVESLAVATSHSPPDDLAAILDEEIDKLPARYRDVVVLCDLQDQTQDEAARQLGCAVGTVKSRLSRGRDKLRARLIRRGVAPIAAAGALCRESLAAEAPAALADATVKAAIGFAAGRTATAGVVSAHVFTLAQGALRSMLLTRIQLMLSTLTTLAAMATGVGVMAMQDASPRRDEASSTNPAPSDAQSTSQPAAAAGKTTADLKPPTDKANQEQRKEEQLDKLDALQLDIELLTDEIRQIKQQISTYSKAFLNPNSSTIEGRLQARLDEAQIEQVERRRAQLQERTRSFPARIDELRERYLAKSKELRQKQRELQALGRSLPEIFPATPAPDAMHRPDPAPTPGRSAATTEQRLTEIERRLDQIMEILKASKH